MAFNVKNGTQVFNNKDTYIEGWYWALASNKLKIGQKVGIEFLGSQLLLYRGESGKVVAMDPYCPHMGAHLKEGKVIGDQIMCAFHGWKFNSSGKCSEIPCQKYADKTDIVPRQGTYPVQEQYGLIWVYSHPDAKGNKVPFFTELENEEVEYVVGHSTFRPCRPEVVMLNAIDAHHFNTVHPEARKMAGNMDLKPIPLSPVTIRLENQTPVPTDNLLGRLMKPFYKANILTYFLDYWYASTGVVCLGPDFLHAYLMFPHRPTPNGGTEGTMVFLAKKRKGILGKLMAKAICWTTYLVGTYFEKGDRLIFESIRFDMKAPVKADLPIIEFIRHVEEQTAHEFTESRQLKHPKRNVVPTQLSPKEISL